jgi:hypothetical protein
MIRLVAEHDEQPDVDLALLSPPVGSPARPDNRRRPVSEPVRAVPRLPDDAAEPERLDVTVVLPCFNEQDHVVAELERISAALDASPFSYELLVIDDASTDGTLDVLQAGPARFPQMRLMPFHRNGGLGHGPAHRHAAGARAASSCGPTPT